MDRFELKVSPPAVALLLALPMWLTSSLGRVDVPYSVRVSVAIALGVVGLSISVAGIVELVRERTTLSPGKASAATSLVTSGVYRYTRNPMYGGLCLTLTAWAVFLSSLLSTIWLAVYVLYVNRFQIVPEERGLSALFGTDYLNYTRRVRRWV